MNKFNLEDYETVDSRIKKFYKKYPEGRILTELVSETNNINTAIIKAYIYNGDILLSTGYAFEIAGQGYVNKTSHLENCETSAIGRGLANIGLNGDKRPSKEEMTKSASLPETKKTGLDVSELNKIVKNNVATKDTVCDLCYKMYNHQKVHDLTQQQLNSLIAALKAQQK